MRMRLGLPYVRFWGGDLGWIISLPCLVGNLNIKPRRSELFSQRNNLMPVLRIGPISFCWVRYR